MIEDKVISDTVSLLLIEVDKLKNFANMYKQFVEITGFVNPPDYKKIHDQQIKLKSQIEGVISASKRVRSQGNDTTDYPSLLQKILDEL